MKSSQWFGALAVLIVMVFVITFALNILGTGKTPDVEPVKGAPTGDGPNVTFYVKALPFDPMDPMLVIYHEENTAGGLNFLFENPNAEDVKVGLKDTSCKCNNVEFLLATPEWKNRRAVIGVAEWCAEYPISNLIWPELFAGAKARLLRPDEDKPLKELERAVRPVAKLEKKADPKAEPQAVVVPARSMGWVRVNWDDTKTGVQRFRATLWVGSPTSGMNPVLDAEVHFVPPVVVENTDLQAGELNEVDLEKKPYQLSIRVWSATRPELKLATQTVQPPHVEDGRFDPFVVGQPVPLSPAEIRDLHRTTPDAATAMCAYRIPVVLYGRSPDGKVAVDLGSFRRRFKVVRDGDAAGKSIEVTLTGSVQGSVLIGTPQDGGRINLGVFDSNAGSPTQTIVLTGKTAALKLDVDKGRTPEFLRDGVRLEQIADVAGLPTWKLRVRVPPDAARGDFPRAADAQYQDSAVYLKVKGEVAQNIRIPVAGTANAQ